VGHFLAAGVHWRRALPVLGEHVAYVHVKDLRDGQVVMYGEGDADLPSLFEAMRSRGYHGGYVVEIEGSIREHNGEANLERCVQYLREKCVKGSA
jgi:inosose dehydratase